MPLGSGTYQSLVARPETMKTALDRASGGWVTRPSMSYEPPVERRADAGTGAAASSANGGVLAVVLTKEAMVLRRQLRPISWMVLEQILLDTTIADSGDLIVRTSARHISEALRLDTVEVARALRVLRDAGLLTMAVNAQRGTRFGLTPYRLLDQLSGLTVQNRPLPTGSTP